MTNTKKYIFIPAEFPNSSGVYLMKDKAGHIIYVGKAKSLRKRLASYFTSPSGLSVKTRALVERICHIDILLTSTEKEALLLEASLITKHRPRYNIALRDDKQYVLFKLDRKTEFPRLRMTRKVMRDGALYFGPFVSAMAAKKTLKLLGRAFPLRKCSDAMFRNRVRPCLNYDIGQCLAPCVKEVKAEEYAQIVKRVELFLAGKTGELLKNIEKKMYSHAEALEFEAAARCRDQIHAVRRTLERQAVVLRSFQDMDILAVAESSGGLGLGQLFIRQGRLIDEKDYFWPGLSLEEGIEALESFLPQFYAVHRFIPPRIVTQYALAHSAIEEILSERRQGAVSITPATNKEHKQLIELARKVAMHAGRHAGQFDLAKLLAKRLGFSDNINRVECVDISHLAGSDVRAGVVVFEHGERIAADSKVYSLPALEGSCDDYGALAAWAVLRAESGPPWPDLFLIDGGKGQLSAVQRAFANLGEKAPPVPLVAIGKGASRRAGELEDHIFKTGRKNPLPLKAGSPEMLYLQRMRDAAHDFSLGRQRKARKKRVLMSEVLALPNVGTKTAKLLWDCFASLDAMLLAKKSDIQAISGIGAKRATQIYTALQIMKKARTKNS